MRGIISLGEGIDMKKTLLLFSSIFLMGHHIIIFAQQEEENVEILYYGKPMEHITAKRANHYFNKFFIDSANIWKKVFTLHSMKVLTAIMPFYLVGRKADSAVHRQLYDQTTHTNKHQPPEWLKMILYEEMMAIPMLGYGILGLLHTDAVERRAAQVFGTGLLWAWASKVIVKEVIKTDANLRPWCQGFSQHEQTHGGNPSGHTTMAAYLATYLWLHKGISWGLPATIYTVGVAGVSVAINHHYLSQVIAGAGFGALFGIAAYSVFSDWNLPENLTVGFDVNNRAQLGLKIAYNF
jgi:membrane-associated phospholipid phosphatase